MARRKSFVDPHQNFSGAVHPVSRLWIFRMLATLGGHKSFFDKNGFNDDDLARLLGFEELVDAEDDEVSVKQYKARMNSLHRQAERDARDSRLPGLLDENARHLGELIGLSQAEVLILEFAVMIHSDDTLSSMARYMGEIDTSGMAHALSVILSIPRQDVAVALQPRGLLAQSGLLTVDHYRRTIESKLDLMSHGLAHYLLSTPVDLTTLMRDSIATSRAAKLTLASYPYLSSFIHLLRSYMKNSLDTGKSGVNVLLHGLPGTGKSEMVRALAQALQCNLFEVSSEDDDGDPRDGEKRLWAFRSAQCLFSKQKNVMLMFDEVEDIFRGGGFSRSAADKSKGWINRMLESNPVPTVWLSNGIHGLDPAFVRRFDLVKEIPVPPKAIREQILRDAAGGILDAPAIKRFSEAEHLSPAVVTRSASVVRSVQDVLEEDPEKVLETIIADTMVAQGLKRIAREDPARLPDVYDPAFINTETDMAALAAGVKESGSARICLYGAPGTGKTAFARWLAEQLPAPLHIKRASDIISMWVGGSEKNIARAFRQAEEEGAVLLIDEVDSFLQDRKRAQRSWEISTVNEMLTQMEAYPGVFIASTNLMDDLDEACLRRFDLKVKFDYLRPEQAWTLFRRHCAGLGLAPGGNDEAAVKALRNLAPGDFAAVVRQSKFRPLPSSESFARALGEECEIKKGGRKGSMGFLA